jgi:2',3'-cyclic-nucleotide 2'-phosphodiesterase (5'-nucleotidase family)
MRLKNTFLLVGMLLLVVGCKTTNHLADIKNENIKLSAAYTAQDEEMAAMLLPYKTQLDEQMNVVIGNLVSDLNKGKLNSSMGNFFADMLYTQAAVLTGEKVDFALQNYGGLRIPFIGSGPITKGKIFELMPFDNTLVILETPGPVLQLLCNRVAEYGGWPISQGITMDISDDQASNIVIQGEPLDLTKTYKVVLADYVANGGDDCDFLIGLNQNNTGIFIREVIIDGIKALTDQGMDIDYNRDIRINKI